MFPTPSTTPFHACAEAINYLSLLPPSWYAWGEWSSIFELEENYAKLILMFIHLIGRGLFGCIRLFNILLKGRIDYSSLLSS